jgi:hypothetical protein
MKKLEVSRARVYMVHAYLVCMEKKAYNSSVAVRVTLRFHPGVNQIPSRHPASKILIWSAEINVDFLRRLQCLLSIMKRLM